MTLVARVDYTDRDGTPVTRLVAVDTRRQKVIGGVGSAVVRVGSMTAQFVRDSDVLVVVYSCVAAKHSSVDGTPSVRLLFSVDDDDDGDDDRRFIKCNTAVQPVATCRQLSYLHKPAFVIMTSGAYGARGARSPRPHYDAILIVTSFATELATPTVTDVRTYGYLTAFNIEITQNACTALRVPVRCEEVRLQRLVVLVVALLLRPL